MENKKRIIIAIVVVVLLIITMGVSYALWTITKEQTGENVVGTTCLDVTIENEENSILIEKTQPILDEEGLKLKPYSFSIKNNCEEYADYTINLEMLEETTLNSEYVKISLSEEGTKGVATNLGEYDKYNNLKIAGTKEGRQIKSGKLKPSEEKKYELRIWMDEDVTVKDDAMNKMHKSKVIVESVLGEKPYTEGILHGTDPVIDGELIPITINEENGSVTRADETKKWYSYGEQQWANAVILRDGIEDPGANEPIDENDIESYFVWIPRYRYEIFTNEEDMNMRTVSDKTKIINIEFESKDEETKNGSKEGEWLTHPAFTSFNTNGLWVGKFETGYDGALQPSDAELNPINEKASIEAANKVIIKPNVYSWRDIQVAKAYIIGRHYEATLNSHMMKSMEWGAVAYLQHSQYGSHASVRINNNSNFLTGYAARQEPTIGYTGTNELCSNNTDSCNEYGESEKGQDGDYNTEYFNKLSVVASTTSNYTGIYDMSGGSYEYVMAGMDDNSTGDGKTGKLASGRNNVLNSGFNGKLTCPECNDVGVNHQITEITEGIALPTDDRYYDKYDYSTENNTYSRGKIGDATKEMGPFQNIQNGRNGRQTGSWYNDEAYLGRFDGTWSLRGGEMSYGTGAGIFDFANSNGNAGSDGSFRLVLAF